MYLPLILEICSAVTMFRYLLKFSEVIILTAHNHLHKFLGMKKLLQINISRKINNSTIQKHGH